MKTAIAILFLLMVLWTSTSAAQDLPAMSEIDRELALSIAKVTMNEASFAAAPEDLYLIAQVVMGWADTNAGRLERFRRHSSCVLTDRPLTEFEQHSNCRWSRHLSWNLEEPENWPPPIEWAGRHQRIWLRMLQLSARIVLGASFPHPCSTTPTTWGGRVIDHDQALRRGLLPLGCTGTANEGYILPRRILPLAVRQPKKNSAPQEHRIPLTTSAPDVARHPTRSSAPFVSKDRSP
jgi:hypothetical protein